MSIRKIKFIASIFPFLFSQTVVFGQVISSAEFKMMTVLNAGANSVPKDLLQTKSIVVISMNSGENSIGDNWKNLAQEAHFYIRKLGIDAVQYFYIDDLIAGYDMQRTVSEQMNAREVKNIFMLSKDNVDGREQFIGVLTPFNQEPTFISNDQVAWKSQTSDLEILFRNLARAIDNEDLTRENLLIVETPEFFRGLDLIRGRRFESYNVDLRIDRLAVPKFVDLPVPQNTMTETGSKMVQLINNENEKNLARNAQLERAMATYPFKFQIVPYEYDEKKLLAKGFQFVLLSLRSSGRNVRELLGYRMNDEVEELITVYPNDENKSLTKAVPIDAVIHKYYIKHINSGEIYLGEQWDGDVNWQDALNNHILSMVAALKRN